MNCNEISTGAR